MNENEKHSQLAGWIIISVLILAGLTLLPLLFLDIEHSFLQTSKPDVTEPTKTTPPMIAQNEADKAGGEPLVNPLEIIPKDEELKRLAIGTWESQYYGLRTLTLNQDGTAVMSYVPEGLATVLIGSKPVTVKITWGVAQGSTTFTLHEGDPQNEVDAMVTLYGKTQTQKILQQDGKNFKLLDKDGITIYEWKKVE